MTDTAMGIPPGMLSNLKVVDASSHAAGPSVGATLGDLGANVIKVEDANAGDPYRYVLSQSHFPDLNTDGKFNAAFELVNRNKRGLAVSLKTPEGQEVLDKLVAWADVFITNKLPRVQKNLNIEYERLKGINPRLIYVALSGYGSLGPLASRPGFDLSAYWASSSQMGMMGKMVGGPPPMNRAGMGDRASGMVAVGAVGLALYYRELTGVGQAIDTSLMHTGLWTVAVDIQRTAVYGSPLPFEKREDAANPLWNSYEAADGKWLLLAFFQECNWSAVCGILGHEELAEDARFTAAAARRDNNHELIPMLEGFFKERSRDEWGERLDASGMPWAPVWMPEEVIASEQVKANGIFFDATHPALGHFPLLRAPFTFSETPAAFRCAAPQLGEHNEEVLAEIGFEESDVLRIQQSQKQRATSVPTPPTGR